MIFNRASALATLALSALSAKAVYFAPVNSTVTQCGTISLSVKGAAPFTVAVWPGCDDDSDAEDPYADYHSNLTTINWKVNVASGKSVMFSVEDADGNIDYTDDYTIKTSSDAACIGVRPSFSSPFTSTSSSAPSTPTTQSKAIGNVGMGASTTMTYSTPESTTTGGIIGGAIGGALTNFAPRVEMAAFVVVGSSLAALLF